MGNKKRMSKILAVVCSVVLAISAMRVPTLVVLGNDSNTPPEYERLTLANFGIKDGQSVAVTGLTSKTDKFNAGDGTLDGTEVKGIFNFSATYDTFSGVNGGGKIYVGGDSKGLVIEAQPASNQLKIMYHDGSEHEMTSGQVRITSDEITDAGFSLFDSDIILSLKFDAEDMTKTETDVQVTITLSDKNDPTKSYSETCTMNQKTEYMSRYMSIMVHRTYNITMKYLEDDFQTITFADFGFEQGQKITKTTVTKNAGEGSLDGVRIEGYVNIPKPSSGASKIMFGQTIGMEFYANGEVWIRTQDTSDGGYANTNPYGVASWNNYWGKDTKLTAEFSYSNMVAGKGTLQMTVKANGTLIATKTTPYTITESRATRSVWIQAANDTEPITVKNDLIINYETLDLTNFNITDEKSIGDWTTTEIGETYTAGDGILHEVDVIGKYKFDSTTFDNGYGTTNYARVYFGGENQNFYMEYRPVQQYLQFGYNAGSGNQSLGEAYRITKADAEAAGLTFFDTELILSAKFVCDNSEAANTDISVILTLSDPSDTEKKVVREMVLPNYPMSGMQRIIRIAQNFSGRLTYAPVVPVEQDPITFENLDLSEFNILEETTIGDWTTTETGNTYTAGEGTLHGKDVIGKYKFDSTTFDNGYGATNYARVYFGGENQNFYMEYRPVQQYLQFGYNAGSGNQSLGEIYRITKADAEAAGLTFFDTELVLSAKFACDNPESDNTDVVVIITLSDPSDAEKKVVREIKLQDYPMSGMQRVMRFAQNFSGRLTYAPCVQNGPIVPEDPIEPGEPVGPEVPDTMKFETLDFNNFGVTEEITIGDWTTTEIGNTYTAGKGTLHGVEVIGKYKFNPFTFDNGHGATNYARVYFGGETENFYMEYRPVQQYLQFGYNVENGNEDLDSSYRITKADAEAAGLTLFDTELVLSVKFVCADTKAKTTNITVIVTLSDADNSGKKVVREFVLAEYPMSGMQRVVRVAQNFSGRMSYAPVVPEVSEGPEVPDTMKFETLDFNDFGVTEEISIGDWTTTEIGNTHKAGKGTLHGVDVIGRYKFGSATFDNGYGTTNYARMYYGGETEYFYVEYRPVQQYLQFGYNAGNGNKNLDSSYRITKENAEAAGLALFDTDLILSVKFVCADSEADATNITVIVTLRDPINPEKKVVRELVLAKYPMSGMQRVVRVAENYSGRITYSPAIPEVVVVPDTMKFETLDFSDFGVFEETKTGDWTTTEIGDTYTAGKGTLHGVDIVGKYKFGSTAFDNGWGTTNYARVYYGGETEYFYMEYRPAKEYLEFGYNIGEGNKSLGGACRITKVDAEAAGLTFFDTDLVLSVKFVCADPEATITKISIIITLSDLNNPEKKVTREVVLRNYPMSGMQRVIRIAQNFGGCISYAPAMQELPMETGPISFEKIGLDDFGIKYGSEISGWHAEQGITYQGGEGYLHATEIVGNYALGSNEYNNGWGTTNYARVYFGEESDNFFVEFSPVHKNIQFGYKKNGTVIKFTDECFITKAEMEKAGLTFFDSYNTMSVKFVCANLTDERSDVKIIVTFSDIKDATKSVTRELLLRKIPMEALKRILTVAQAYDCRLKYEPLEVVVKDYTGEIEKIDIGYFGVEEIMSISGWTTKEQQLVFSELKGILHATEVIGNFKFDATKFDNNYGTTNYTRVYYGGAGTGFYVEYRPVQEYLRFGYIDANGTAVNINQAYNITKADLEAAGLKLTGEQLTMKVKFICATPDDETSDLKVVVTICDPDEESKSVMREMTIADFPMSGMNRVLTIAQNYNGIMQFGPKSFVVTGNKVNFKRFGFTENWAKELELR